MNFKLFLKNRITFFLLIVLLLPRNSFGQAANTYCFRALSGTYAALTGATNTSLGASDDDAVSTSINIGFSFVFGGTTYTQVKASSNGFISFGSPDTQYSNTLPYASAEKPFLFPLWDDLVNNMRPRYVVSGTAPNRIFKMEWSQRYYSSASDVIAFQVWLYETSNVIEYIYNPVSTTSFVSSASIGIYDQGGNFISLDGSGSNPLASSTTFTTTINAKPISGQIYRFTPFSSAVSNKWNGSAWSLVSPPTADQNIEFAGPYSLATDVVACSCLVSTAAVVDIPTGNTLKLGGALTVSSGSITFENNASLLQTTFIGANSGSIFYKRQTTINRNTDFTYWSSPVIGQTLFSTSPLTLASQYFSFNATTNSWSREASSKVMVAGVGYIIRGSETHKAPNPAATDLAVFNGVPNNGTINVPIVFTDPTGTSNLIGNPYPSAIYADKFLAANSTYIDGTLY
ncbi:MAG: hypothetical protein ACH345_09745, partial [Flavobacterium sp.]